ncbi:hypothetical protein QP164_05965 [Sphingomonas sp. LR59]|uniref:hypothetical protein n=1 Tax=Sphingomonas sp. LR59 TaxID=3050232 RepID=UPI002FE109C2
MLRATIVGISALAIIGPALVVANAPTIVHVSKRVKLPPGRVVPQAEVPQVEPVKFVDLTPDDARAFNATVPFSTAPNPLRGRSSSLAVQRIWHAPPTAWRRASSTRPGMIRWVNARSLRSC